MPNGWSHEGDKGKLITRARFEGPEATAGLDADCTFLEQAIEFMACLGKERSRFQGA